MVATTKAQAVEKSTNRKSFTNDPLVAAASSVSGSGVGGKGRRHSVAVASSSCSATSPSSTGPWKPLSAVSSQKEDDDGGIQQLQQHQSDDVSIRPAAPVCLRSAAATVSVPAPAVGPRAGDPTKQSESAIVTENPSLLRPKLFLSRRKTTTGAVAIQKEEIPCGLQLIGPARPDMEAAITDILLGFRAHVPPVAVDDGTGGVYYLRSKTHRILAVFKPSDEEPFAINNPKDHRPLAVLRRQHSGNNGNNNEDGDQDTCFSGSSSAVAVVAAAGIRSGISPGCAAVREVASYLLDHGHRAKVPPTVLVAAHHPSFFVHDKKAQASKTTTKIGSLQLYIPHDCTAEDLSERVFPVDQVHAMAMLDIRLANQDRHGGNVLVLPTSTTAATATTATTRPQARGYDLVPIDHGACLPRISCLDETSFLWLEWPQAKIPFSSSAKASIASLDGIADAERVTSQLPASYQVESDALLTLAVCTALLQVCVLDYDMTANAIGLLMCREDPSQECVLERLVQQTLANEKPQRTTTTTSGGCGQWQRSMATRITQRFRSLLKDHLKAQHS